MKRNVLIWSIVLVLAGVIAAGGTYLVLRDDGPSETVLLEPADDDGPDPFTESVSLVAFDGVPAAAAPALSATIESLPVDDSTGMRVASGATAGLFGGSRSDAVCDVATLDAFLSAEKNSAKAAAFAEASGIDAADLSGYLRSLTPVLLGGDTLVTNHGFSNGKLTSRQSVLQAGTAVLVDDRGVPRVRCSCGNPLTEPETSDLTNVSSPGEPWEGFDTERVLVPAAAPAALGTFVLVDVADGSTYEQAPGEAAAMWIVVGGDEAGGQVQVSSDAEQWRTTLETPVALHGVAHGDGRSVVVGGSAAGGGAAGGIIVATDNGDTWSAPIETAAGLVDVAYGAGTWVALSQRLVYTSDDGTNWVEQAPLPFEYSEISADGIAFGDGAFVVTSHSCGASRCFPAETLRSGDGLAWTVERPGSSDSGIVQSAIGFSDQFALVGYEWLELGAGQSNADQLTTPAVATMAGPSLTAVPQAPGSPYVSSLSGSSGGWYGVGSTATAANEPNAPRQIFTSSDLGTWARVGSLSGLLNDVILIGRATRPAAAPEPAGDTSGSIVIRAAALELLDEQGTLSDTIAYDSAVPAAIAALNRVLGEPSGTESIEGDGTCVADSTSTSWGSFTLVHDGSDAAAAAGFTVYLGDGAPGPVSTVAGIAPGAPAGDAAAAAATGMTRSLSHDGVQWQWFLLDVPASESSETTGVLATAQNGTVTGLAAPEFLEDQC